MRIRTANRKKTHGAGPPGSEDQEKLSRTRWVVNFLQQGSSASWYFDATFSCNVSVGGDGSGALGLEDSADDSDKVTDLEWLNEMRNMVLLDQQA
jgi:hypothetical protein